MHVMRILHWLFAVPCKECEDGVAEFGCLLSGDSCIDCIFTKAVEGMVLEVCCGCIVLQVLKVMDNMCTSLELWSSTGKNMVWSTLIILKGNIWFEE